MGFWFSLSLGYSKLLLGTDGVAEEEGFDPFVKPKDAREYGKYTPLYWASYKGFFKVV
jgi:hypothetical protein